jgi:hypothetical protein
MMKFCRFEPVKIALRRPMVEGIIRDQTIKEVTDKPIKK